MLAQSVSRSSEVRIGAWSTGIGEACKGVSNCVLGGSVVDSWRTPRP